MIPSTTDEGTWNTRASSTGHSEDTPSIVQDQREDANSDHTKDEEGFPMLVTDTNLGNFKIKTATEGGIVNFCGVHLRRRQRTLAIASIVSFIATCWCAVEVIPFKLTSSGGEGGFGSSSVGSWVPSINIVLKAGSALVFGEHLLYDPDIYPWARDIDGFIAKLGEAKEAVQARRQALWDKHAPVSADFFEESMGKINEGPLIDNMVKVILEQSNYVIGVMGTSVTAGHDNLFSQSYPVVWGVEMQEAFAAAGVNLTVRNGAMGWNPINPSYYCQGELIGEDAHIVTWEFAMMGGGDPDIELFMRHILHMDNQPHILFLTPGMEARGPGEPQRTEEKPGKWFSGIAKQYAEHGYSIFSNNMQHAFWLVDHLDRYNHDAIFANKVTSGVSWHPGPWGHECRADILAWNYLGHFEEAVNRAYDAVSTKQENLSSILPKPIPVPEPIQCPFDLCNTRPVCRTTFEPRQGPTLIDYVTSPVPIPYEEDLDVSQSSSRKDWHHQLAYYDVAAVKKMKEQGLGYLDRKYVIQGTNEAGPLIFEFDTNKENYIILCAALTYNDAMTENCIWTIDGEEIKPPTEDESHAIGNPAPHDACFITRKKYAPGHHVFQIEMRNPLAKADQPVIAISHLIHW